MVKDAIGKLSKHYYVTERATVLSVDKAAATCAVRSINDDLELDAVALKPIQNTGDDTVLGIVPYPAIGSVVLIAFVDNDPSDAFVLQWSALQGIAFDFGQGLQLDLGNNGKPLLNANKITLNGGNNGGMVLLMPLLQAINDLQSNFNDLRMAFVAHAHTGVTTGPGVSGTTTTPPPNRMKLTRKKDLENTKITQ
jgi:hypothetical protein